MPASRLISGMARSTKIPVGAAATKMRSKFEIDLGHL